MINDIRSDLSELLSTGPEGVWRINQVKLVLVQISNNKTIGKNKQKKSLLRKTQAKGSFNFHVRCSKQSTVFRCNLVLYNKN